jgi:nitrogen fixation NifU-like protein
MGGLDDLYQQLILDHYRNRRNRGRLPDPTVAVRHHNPLCGDEILLELLIEDGRVTAVRHDGDGCSISQAAASMMSEVVTGLPLDEALARVEHFRLMMHGDEAPDEDLLGDAVALEGVRRYPVRVKCALLSWMALKDAILAHEGARRTPAP